MTDLRSQGQKHQCLSASTQPRVCLCSSPWLYCPKHGGGGLKADARGLETAAQ